MTTRICEGNGYCFEQSNEGNYKSAKTRYHKCTLKKCPGYKWCKRELPDWLLDCNSGFCINCAVALSSFSNKRRK